VVGSDFGAAGFGSCCLVLDLDPRAVSSSLTQQLDFRLSDFPSSVSTFGISFSSLRTGAPMEVFRIDLLVFRFCEQSHRWRYFGSIFWYFIFVNSCTNGGISDRSFGISFLRTVAPTEVFRIDHLVFHFCEQAYRRSYFGRASADLFGISFASVPPAA
jgi:hypothetical protein